MRHAAFLVAALTIGADAGAEPVRFDWTGTVTYADPTLASAGIVVGAPASGHYRFESTTPDGDPDAQVGFYDEALREWGVAVGLIDNTTTGPGFGSISVALDWEGMSDIYEVRAGPAVLLRLTDLDHNALASQALPVTPPALAEFEGAGVAQLDPVTFEPLAVIAVESLTLSPAAIPALPSWGAFVLSLCLLTSCTTVRSRRAGRDRTFRLAASVQRWAQPCPTTFHRAFLPAACASSAECTPRARSAAEPLPQ